MRADRLLSLLMLLQTRHRVTASEVADQLEVSVRTARRDLEALMISGVPVYPQPGRGGGWQLIGGATTDLTGLSSNESKAIFLAVAPTLDKDPKLRSAMLKLLSALPESFRNEAQSASEAIKVDDSGWGYIDAHREPDFLSQATTAVVDAKQADLEYRDQRNRHTSRRVHPLGLVTKRSIWYMIASTEKGIRAFRVDRITSLEITDLSTERPAGFDLATEWKRIVASYSDRTSTVTVTAEVDVQILGPLRWSFRQGLSILTYHDDTATVSISAESVRSIGGRLAMFGQSVRLLDAPDEVITELRRIATELGRMYL